MLVEERNEGKQGGSFPRATNHYGDVESLRGAPKSPNNFKSTFFNTGTHCFQKSSVSNIGAPSGQTSGN